MTGRRESPVTEQVFVTGPNGELQGVEDRDALLRRLRTAWDGGGRPASAIMAVYLLLVDGKRRLRVVRRSPDKRENPGLWDKTAGGGVRADRPYSKDGLREIFDDTLRREAFEELGLSLKLAENEAEFQRLSRETEWHQLALVRIVDHDPWLSSVRLATDGTKWVRKHNVAIYIGRFDGGFEFHDGEATEEKRLSMASLERQLRHRPNEYTEDLPHLLSRYRFRIA